MHCLLGLLLQYFILFIKNEPVQRDVGECIELQNWWTSPLLCNLAANKGVGTLERVIGQLMSPIKKENCSAKKTLTNQGGLGGGRRAANLSFPDGEKAAECASTSPGTKEQRGSGSEQVGEHSHRVATTTTSS